MNMDWSIPRRDLPPRGETESRARQRLEEVRRQAGVVFGIIDELREDAVALLQELVGTPSVNPSDDFESKVAAVIAGHMRDMDMKVDFVEPAPRRVNNMGSFQFSSEGPVLALHCHMDTVPPGNPDQWSVPPFGGVVRDGKLYGRGAKDSKLGIAAQLMTLRALQQSSVDLKGTLKLSQEADEEMGGHYGSHAIVESGFFDDADWVLYTEGTPQRISVGHRGILWVQITGHAVYAEPTVSERVSFPQSWKSMKHRTSNPILQMLEVARAVDTMQFSPVPPDPVVPGASGYATVNKIWGGTKENAMPDQCCILADIRTLPGLTAEQALADITEELNCIRRRQAHLGGLAVEDPKVVMAARASSIDPDEPLVIYLQHAIREVMGIDVPAHGSMGGGGGSRWICLDAKVPVAGWAAGRNTSHRPDEHIDIEDYINTIKVYALLAMMKLG